MTKIIECPLCKHQRMTKENTSFWDWQEEGGFWQLIQSLINFWVYVGFIYLFISFIVRIIGHQDLQQILERIAYNI
jgi:hypothetical protein